MRAWAWVGVGVGAVVLAVGATAVGLVSYVQNNDMRSWAEWGAARAGVPVQFAGPVSVKLWPELVVKTQGVEVASLQGEGMLARVEALALQAAWGGGLRPWEGLQLRAIEAKNPTITLTRNQAGVANWQTPDTAAQAKPAAAKESANPLADLTARGGILASVRLAIASLNLTYTDAQSGQKVAVRNMNIGARTNGTVATTTLRGTVNGQPLNGELVADVADFANIPLKAKLEGAGAGMALEGRVINQNGFAGLVNARSGNLQQTLQTLLGKAPPQAPASPASLTGDVVLQPEQVTLRNFSARLGELLQARGDVDLTLGSTPRGRGTVSVQGANLRALAELGSGTKQPALPARPFNLQAKLAGEEQIEIRDFSFNLEPVLQVRGNINLTPKAGTQPDVTTNLTVQAPNLQALLQAFGQTQTAPTQPLQATVNVQGQGGRYTLQAVQARVGELASAAATGTVNTSTAKPVLDLDAKLDGPNMAAAAAGFGIAGELPASGFSIRSKVRGNSPYELEGLTVNLPGLAQVLANLSYTPGAPANLQGTVNISELHATRLGYCGNSRPETGSGSGAATGQATGGAPWSDAPLDLSGLRQLALNLTVKASGITCANVPVESAAFTLRNTPSQLDVEGLNLAFADNQGRITGAMALAHAGTPRLNTQLALNGLQLHRLVPTLAARGVELPLNGAVQLASQGNSTRALAQNLGGRLEFAARDGRLPYENMLGNVVTLERLLQGQMALPNNGDGRLESLNVVVALRQGVGTFETLTAATANGAMKLAGTGQFDLPNWTIDLTLTPTLTTTQALAVPILVRGPLTAPAIGADPAFTDRLTKRLATEGVKSLLNLNKDDAKGLGGVVGDMLGGKGVTQEGVGNLLNQFVKPKAAPTPTASSPTAPAPASTAPAETSPVPTPPAAPPKLEDALPGLLNDVLGQ
ncbi:MAG: hypothetical protein INF43_05380 [Alphaproteobacteria bacterium]|nr:hypothetical protein [Alphaproteobacteria bacterium]